MKNAYFTFLVFLFIFIFLALNQLKTGAKLQHNIAGQNRILQAPPALKNLLKTKEQRYRQVEPEMESAVNGRYYSPSQKSNDITGSIQSIRNYYELAAPEGEAAGADSPGIVVPKAPEEMLNTIKDYYKVIDSK